MKLAVSLPENQVNTARRAVQEGRALSVSAYISQALERAEQEDSLMLLLADLNRELGEPAPEVRAAVTADLKEIGLLA